MTRRLLADYPEELALLEQALTRGQGGQEGNDNAAKERRGPTQSETNRSIGTVRLPKPKRGNTTQYAVRRLTREAAGFIGSKIGADG